MMLNDVYRNWETIFKKCLSDLKNCHPNLNDGQIAKMIGVPRATFNRMKNEKKVPKLDNMLKILIGSNNIDLISNAVDLIEEGLGYKLKSALEISLNEKEIIAENKRMELIFEDRDVFVAYLISDRKNGASVDEIKNALGEIGAKSIQTLIQKNLAFELNERIHIKKRGTLLRSFDSVKYHLNTYTKFYQPDNVGTQKNYVHTLSEGLNQEGLKQAHLAHKEFHQKIQAIFREGKYHGDIPAFSVGFCDSFLNKRNP